MSNLEQELTFKIMMYDALMYDITHGRTYNDDQAELRVNQLAERCRELEHQNRLLKHALYVANDEEDYYVYIPDEENYLKTLGSDIPVRISSTWLKELIEEAYENGKNSVKGEIK